MTADYFHENVEHLMRRMPFQPFIIELVGGNRFEIDHPGAIAWRGGFAVFVGPGTKVHYFDHESVTQFIDHTAHASR